MPDAALDDEVDRIVRRLAEAAQSTGQSVATAESLTGGQLAAAISAASNAGDWYRGGVVAYHPEVKYALLEAPHGPVVTARTAETMARSTLELLGADYSVAVTGVGGPEPQEGKPAGTVFPATCTLNESPESRLHHFAGDPVQVMEQTIRAALTALLARISD